MKLNLLLTNCMVMLVSGTMAQVTQINSNNSLHVRIPLNINSTILVSAIDSSIWTTNATLAGTVQISPTIKYEETGALLAGKLIFRGRTATTGSELYVTDGTAGGTQLVKDIYSGALSSTPTEMTTLNGFIYFTAVTAAEGRELWRTDGTPGGTSIVKDIIPGTDSSNVANNYQLFSNGAYLLFAARSPGLGIELWKSDGSNAGTVLLKDINTGNAGADSSNPGLFYALNNIVLFTATDLTHGEEIWRTDGTPGGTTILKDINVGTGSATGLEIFPGFFAPVFQGFHTFNNHAYFGAFNGTSTGQVWSTDGSSVNTTLLKDIIPGIEPALILVVDAVNLPGKFIFPVGNGTDRSELWESDGTPAGTNVFKTFTPADPANIPIIFIPFVFNINNTTFSQPLFQGNKFFFSAGSLTEGNELWISDGSLGGTHLVKDIFAGTGDGIDLQSGISYLYTSSVLFFKGTTMAQGNELWKSDGTSPNTTIVADIYTNAGDADPELTVVSNGNKVIFSATNGDDPLRTDLYVVDGNFTPIPLKMLDFTVQLKISDALLHWTTVQEVNSRDFTIQRSYDGMNFENIGIVKALGNTGNQGYNFTDPGIIHCNKSIVYYRLVVSDQDGKTASSNVIILKLGSKSPWDVQLLSNPVGNSLQVLLNGTSGNVQFLVQDMQGKTVYTMVVKNTNGQVSLPASLQAGSYILVTETNNEKKAIKFIKE